MQQNLKLFLESGKQFYYKNDSLKEYNESINDFLSDLDYMKTYDFSKKIIFNHEIQTNNNIEGIKSNLYEIDRTINNLDTTDYKRKRITNLYNGYKYIYNNQNINKESLKELYSILSKDILGERDVNNMGDYYRTKPVYILNGNFLDRMPYMGVDEDRLEEFMNYLFDFINESNNMDNFLKSQIIHFYFVYIHPYFDVNGRTSRTLSMWYLLNNKEYPYVIFNRAISNSKNVYEKNIIKARQTGDLTFFLKYMLSTVELELEKELILNNINKKININSMEEQILEYILNTNGNLTVKDLLVTYNNNNEKKHIYDFYEERLKPIIDKNIIVIKSYCKSYIKGDTKNFYFKINSELIEDNNKVKKIDLKKYID